jgi:hypothetical protein
MDLRACGTFGADIQQSISMSIGLYFNKIGPSHRRNGDLQ